MKVLKSAPFLASAFAIAACQEETTFLNKEPDGSFTIQGKKERFSYDSYLNLCVYAHDDLELILVDRKCDGHVDAAIYRGNEISPEEIIETLDLDPYAILKNYYAKIRLEEAMKECKAKPEPKKAEIRNVTKDNFEALVLKAEKPVLVDFYADWCFTCAWLDEDMPKLIAYFDGRMDFYKFDVMSDEGIVNRYGARSLPALRLFYKNEVVCKTSGYGGGKDYEILKATFEKCLRIIEKPKP